MIHSIGIDSATGIVKSFAPKRKGYARPILKTALVTESHVIATDAHRLIRVAHGESDVTPYLHRYNENDALNADATTYPNVDRLFPNTSDCQTSFTVNVNAFKKAHNELWPYAKESQNNKIYLSGGKLWAQWANDWESLPVDVPEDIRVGYNCRYMKEALVAIGKTKAKEVTVHFYGHLRPLLLTAPGVEVMVLPVRSDTLNEVPR